jgi:hypothetical protein
VHSYRLSNYSLHWSYNSSLNRHLR